MDNPNPIAAFVPLIVMTIPFIFLCRGLAKQKGKHIPFWTLIGCLPSINIVGFIFLVGARDEVLHEKVDKLLAKKVQENGD